MNNQRNATTSTHRPATPKFCRSLLTPTVMLLCVLPEISTSQGVSMELVSGTEAEEVERLDIPFGQEVLNDDQLLRLDSRDPPENAFSEGAVLAGYCDETGVPVYVGARTGVNLVPGRRFIVGAGRVTCQTIPFTKNTTDATAQFTVTPSYLEIQNITRDEISSTAAQISIQLCQIGKSCTFEFLHYEVLVGVGGLLGQEFFDYSSNFALPSTNKVLVSGNTVVGARVDIFEYSGDINLSAIDIGADFFLIYEITVAVSSPGGESTTTAFLRDPLNVDEGIGLVTGPGVSPSTASTTGQICNAGMPRTTPDDRFTIADNGTVHDTMTLLNWPRCPQGYTLQDNATNDLADDSCAASGTTDFTWQAALEEAANANNSGLAGTADWRLPNIKELHSIVESACNFPAQNPLVFPPINTNETWSSTANDVGTAEYLRYDSGLFRSASQGTPYSVRLVRTEINVLPPTDEEIFADGFE